MSRQVIGSNIKRWRLFRGKKQSVFAKEIGVSRVMLSRYENGHTAVTFELLKTIAEQLQIEINKLTD
jgi:transcriptional regulator with XRE-family HTH domain